MRMLESDDMTRTVLSFGNFLLTAQLYLIVYAFGPYLAAFMPASETGLVIAAGAILTLILFPLMPQLVGRHGARRIAIAAATVESIALLWLALAPSLIVIIALVALVSALPALISYLLDLMLEATIAEESSTGRIRTAFLTCANIAVVIAPFVAGILISATGSYRAVFLAAAATLVPLAALLLARRIPAGAPPDITDMRRTLVRMFRDRDLRSVSIAYFVLRSFYQWTNLYIPLYLHTTLGVSWAALGLMLALSMLPYVLIEYPVGVMADRFLGDKEFIFGGFLVIGFSYALGAFITAGTTFAVMLGIMVAMNVGGAFVEAATEGHFFRRVSERDANTVGVFRMARPASTLIAPIFGSLLLALCGYGPLFVLSGLFIVTAGSAAALSIKDFR